MILYDVMLLLLTADNLSFTHFLAQYQRDVTLATVVLVIIKFLSKWEELRGLGDYLNIITLLSLYYYNVDIKDLKNRLLNGEHAHQIRSKFAG